DRAVERLAGHPVLYACVNAGGDLRVTGDAPDFVDIRDPARPREHAHRAPLTHAAAATSASYFRQGDDEILHPRHRAAVTTGSSVTVFAHSCMVADALTKVVLLAGPEISERVLESYGAASLVLGTAPVLT
ncbi:MAG TPA: FAD:protein FMN transferase, partial [Kiritimatiellia bacterium]